MKKQIHLTATCVGIYRPRPGNPGFGIPVFESMGKNGLYVQVVKNGEITDFQECDVEREVLLVGEVYPSANIGDPELCAFENAKGKIILCEGRSKMRAALKVAVTVDEKQFMKTPFVLCDIAEYIGDKDLLARAEKKCKRLLEATRRKGKRTS